MEAPNPAVLGPGMLDHPSVMPRLMSDPRFKLYVTTCDGTALRTRQMERTGVLEWNARIDIDESPVSLEAALQGHRHPDLRQGPLAPSGPSSLH